VKTDQNMRASFIKWLAIVALSATASMAWAEGDPIAGHKKNHSCTGCHGIPGWRTAFPEVYKVPLLGGQGAAYIVAALKAYKSGERKHGTMQAIAASMTEQDMADLAAYYAKTAAK
jgi:cytochrome c553